MALLVSLIQTLPPSSWLQVLSGSVCGGCRLDDSINQANAMFVALPCLARWEDVCFS